MREMSVTEQRYKAVLAVIADGRTVTQVARDWDVARQTVHVWLERYEADGLEGLSNGSHRPAHCPHQMPAAVEPWRCSRRRAKSHAQRPAARAPSAPRAPSASTSLAASAAVAGMWSTPFSRQMSVEKYLDRRLGEPPGEDLAVVGQDLGRQPIRL